MWPVLLVDGAKKPTGWVDHWNFDDLVKRLTYLRNAKQKLEAPGWLPVPGIGGSGHLPALAARHALRTARSRLFCPFLRKMASLDAGQ